jgi:hypothetical protein
MNVLMVLQYLGFRPLIDFTVGEIAGAQSIDSWRSTQPQPTPEQIEAARLPATKAMRIEADRQECRRLLVAQYGDALEQVSRAAGLYGTTAQANHAAGVEATIDASNTARDLINAATTVEQVEAVTVAWPVLT